MRRTTQIQDGTYGQATLRNTSTLTEADKEFVSAVEPLKLSELEFRALLEVCRSGWIDNARLRHIAGVDTLAASTLLRALRVAGLLRLHAAGPASYYEPGHEIESRLPGLHERIAFQDALPLPDRRGSRRIGGALA